VAVVWLFRVAIAAAPFGEPALRYVQTHDPVQPFKLGRSWYDRLTSSPESDEDLSVALSEQIGYPAAVATFTGSFELRRVQLSWATSSAAALDEDVRVCTFHHIKLASGSPVDTWDAGDFSDLNTAYVAWWTAIKPWFPTTLVLDTIKYYREGPSVEPPQVPVHENAPNAAGTSGDRPLPPQIAVSVTEKAGSKLNWGRFFLPAPAVTGPTSGQTVDVYGRPSSTFLGAIADASDTLYEAARTAELPFVVYRRTLPERLKKAGGTLAARAASAWEVSDLQVDNVFDVIRSRRFDGPTLRVQREIGA
jgi:hypothetical protein